MRIVLAVLIILLGGVGIWFFKADQASRERLRQTTDELLVASNRAVAAEIETTSVKSQMVSRVAELEQSITALDDEKAKVEARAKEMQSRLETIEKELAGEQAKLTAVTTERMQVTGRLQVVSNQLVAVQGQLAELQKRNDANLAEIEALRNQRAILENERDSLERQLNDLDELQTRIRIVKNRLWDEHVAEWKRRDREAAATGNAGLLMKGGQWQSGTPAEAVP